MVKFGGNICLINMKRLAFILSLSLMSCDKIPQKPQYQPMISIDDAMKIYVIAWTDGANSSSHHIHPFGSWGNEEFAMRRSFDSLKFREAIFNK